MSEPKNAAQPLLTVRDLNVSYATGHGDVMAVQGVNLAVHPGQMTAIVGESGSGKTTSAMATIGLLPAACALIAMIIFMKYPLTDERFKEIRNETEARKLAAIEAHHEDPDAFITPDHKV